MGKKIFMLVALVMALQGAAQAVDNGNCIIGKCAKCEYLVGGYSCSSCKLSKRVIVPNKEGEQFEHFSCSSEKIAIEDCTELAQLPSGESDASKCVNCRWGYMLTTDQTRCKIIQFPDCIKANVQMEEGKEVEQCEICKKGLMIRDGSCQKVEAKNKIDNCSLYARDPDDGGIVCHLCANGYFESAFSKVCVKDPKKTQCVEGEQAPGQTDTCVACETKRDFWAVSLQNNFTERQVCEYQQTIMTKIPEKEFEIQKFFWAIALVVIVMVICAVQCVIFGSRKHLYAENKKGYRPQGQEDEVEHAKAKAENN